MTRERVLRFLPERGVSRRVRADARSAAAALGAVPERCDVLALIVDELTSNAIEHGASYRVRGEELVIRIGAAASKLVLDFLDPEMPDERVEQLRGAIRVASEGRPSLESERGRGLFLLSVFLHDLRVEVAEGGGLHLSGTLSMT
ncbi:MAG: hypothetical protein Fur0037_03870 [Planctomycetota bacterium]